MSEKTSLSYGKSFLVLILPISIGIIFFVNTWRIWLLVLALLVGLRLLQTYQWQQWCTKTNPLFNRLIQENQGRITPIDLSVKGNFSGSKSKRYLDTKAEEFGASIIDDPDGNKVYQFITSSTLGSILDSSEPEYDESPAKVLSSASTELLAAPISKPEVVQKEVESESEVSTQTVAAEESNLVAEEEKLESTDSSKAKSLGEQLLFGSLIQSELAKRLGVYSSTVYKRRNDPKFPEWSRDRDPDGIAWNYSKSTKEFFPVEDNETA
ncbi:MAG: hypothetical protein AAF378_11625 [Cyanobacteria bacterium P01_A01_bin.84]